MGAPVYGQKNCCQGHEMGVRGWAPTGNSMGFKGPTVCSDLKNTCLLPVVDVPRGPHLRQKWPTLHEYGQFCMAESQPEILHDYISTLLSPLVGAWLSRLHPKLTQSKSGSCLWPHPSDPSIALNLIFSQACGKPL